MIQALLWKEYREHRVVWGAVAVMAALLLYGLVQLSGPERVGAQEEARYGLRVLAATLAWMYGLVCGSMLLAGEREEETLTFLDTLPSRRLSLWGVKCLVGVVLMLAQVLVLLGLLAWLRLAGNGHELILSLIALLIGGVLGYGWGMLFSAHGRNVLYVVLLAIIGQFAAGGLLVVLSWVLLACLQVALGTGSGVPRAAANMSPLAVLAILLAAPLLGSAWVFTRPDRERTRVSHPARRPATLWRSYRSVLWLSLRQVRLFSLGLAAFGLVLGFLLPLDGLFIWPAATLAGGVIAGVTTVGDEQRQGAFRFLGDQRLPYGRVWLIKVAVRFALAVGVALLVLLPGLVLALINASEHPTSPTGGGPIPYRFAVRLFDSSLLAIIPLGSFLLLWLVYGFCTGHLSALLFRNSLVAAVVALAGSGLLVAVWIPSLLNGGLDGWEQWGVPLVLLVTARLLWPAWTADRLLSLRTGGVLVGAAVAAGLWVGLALWHRVAEIPLLPDTLDMPAFVASLPTPEENEAGRLIREAASGYQEREEEVREKVPQGSGQKSLPALYPSSPPAQSCLGQAWQVPDRGWPSGATELGRWLDQMFDSEWPRRLADAADKPLGVVENPRYETIASRLTTVQPAREMGTLLAARGLQLQARGNDRAFVDNLQTGLALARNLRHHSGPIPVLISLAVERALLDALDHWLGRLQGRPDLLRRALEVLRDHEKALPRDLLDMNRAEYLGALNSLERPEVLLGAFLPPVPGRRYGEVNERWYNEVHLVALAWRVPWEAERNQRILRRLFEGPRDLTRQQAEELGVLGQLGLASLGKLKAEDKDRLCQLHAAQLEVALRLYQAEVGRPADQLSQLVPRYLPEIPSDPFDGRWFRYRLSPGESIGWPEEPGSASGTASAGGAGGMMAGSAPVPGGAAGPAGMMGMPPTPTRKVPAGQGILWSVGRDGVDDGGRQQASSWNWGNRTPPTAPGEDLIFLVPLPPGKERKPSLKGPDAGHH